MRRLCTILLLWGSWATAAEVMPPAPRQYFNDYAHVVSPATATRLNSELEDFERKTSNQIVVAVFPKMQSDSSIEDYTVRVAQSWKVGQKGNNNGAVLFVFIQDRKMYLQVGYGLEPVLTDALSKQIIEYEIKPRFKNGDYDGGLSAGVAAILKATTGEYKGTGRTVADRGYTQSNGKMPGLLILLLVLFAVFFFALILPRAFGRSRSSGGWWIGSGGFSSGGGFSGGGGGFSGGGGSFGGGGAGGSW